MYWKYARSLLFSIYVGLLAVYFALFQFYASHDVHLTPSDRWPIREQFSSTVFFLSESQDRYLSLLWDGCWLFFVTACLAALIAGDVSWKRK